MKSKEQYRQGDVLIIRDAKAPKAAVPLKPEDGRIILSRGEATGHHHSVDCSAATATIVEPEMLHSLRVSRSTELRHHRHEPIPLRPGNHTVIQQREWWSEERKSRKVFD